METIVTHIHAPPLSSFYHAEEEELITYGLMNVDGLEIFHNQYEIGELIGRGSFSNVYICHDRHTKIMYAVKVIEKRLCIKKKRLRDEIEVLKRVKHQNIIKLIQVYESETELLLVMERAMGGELFDQIIQTGKYSERQAVHVMHQLLGAVEQLHLHGIIHRDIKPENLLLMSSTDHTKIQLSDFGIAKIFEDSETISLHGRRRTYTSCGTDYYVAPEVLKGNGYDYKIDLWSIGVVMYILLCGFPPFVEDETGVETMYQKISLGKFEFPSPYWTNISNEAKDLIQHLLTVDPDHRYNASESLKHPWIQKSYPFGSTEKSTLSCIEDSDEGLLPASSIDEMRRFIQKCHQLK